MAVGRSAEEVIDDALYGPHGFYTTGRGAGRGRDFLTSPELGPLFGAVVSRFVEARWNEAGRPGDYLVVEAAAGSGALARSMNLSGPRWLCVERSPRLRTELAGHALNVSADLPAKADIVFANELLDNLAPIILERTPDSWAEVRVDNGREVLAPWAGDVPPVDARPGARIPIHRQAKQWIARTRATGAHVVCVDYTSSTQRLAHAPMDEWLRTYTGHGRGTHWLDNLGEQDITCQVCVDQLAPDRATAQADWLRQHGLDDLVAEARATWEAGASRPDLVALRARSRLSEAKALTDPAGLGGFTVLEWLPDRADLPTPASPNG